MVKKTSLPAFFLLCCTISYAGGGARRSDGRPADNYWQQRVDYSVEAELFPSEHRLNGKAVIVYSNNSPDTLRTLVWHLYQNVFRKDTSPRKNNMQSGRAYAVTEGMTVQKIAAGGKELRPAVDETVMETPLHDPLLPGAQLTLSVEWTYEITRNADLRTGSEGADFGLCQWYPQIAVYDNVRGWDRTQYLGIAEFYTEYGNWKTSLTVPAQYIVAATGTLENPAEVLTPEQTGRLAAVTADSVVSIIPSAETGEARKGMNNEKRTWKYAADTVRDFAWAASPDYVWDGTKTEEGVLIHAFYKAKDYRASLPVIMDDATNWDYGATMAKHTIEFFSRKYGMYVYPQATVVSGPVSGMEYPMMVFIENGDALSNALNFTIAHELGHEWYPMMIGSDETSHPFMDEGFTTYITSQMMEKEFGTNAYANRDFAKKYSWMNLPDNNDRIFQQRIYLMEAQAARGASLMSHPYDIPQSEYGVMAYMKPGSVLVMLEDLLGKETFEKAMNEYFRRWLYKHPSPDDFFDTVEDVAGRDLDWFWHQWFEETWRLDISLNGIRNEKRNGWWKTTLVLENKEQAKMPATVRLALSDGTTRDVRFSETIWDRGYRAEFVVDSLPAAVDNAVVDPYLMLSDIDWLNNTSSFPVSFDYGFNLLNALFYPLDSYRINAGPSAGFNLQDGAEIGARINGSYIATDHNLTAAVHYGFRSDVPDLELSYSTPLRFWDPSLTTSARVFRLDGFSGWKWNIEKAFEQRKQRAGNYFRRFIVTIGFFSIRVNDVRYLDNPAEWNMTDVLDIGSVAMQYSENFRWGKFFLQLEDEFAAPTRSFSYSKLSVESALDHPLIFGMRMNWRIFAGGSAGTVPQQTAWSLTQSTPVERFDNWIFRTPVVGRWTRSHFTRAGGGNLFLEHDSSAMQVAALNISLNRGPIVLFADAGTLWDSSAARWKQFYYDAGIGYHFSLGGISLGSIRSGPIGFGLFFPVWVRDPSRPADKEIDYRWRIVFGVRF